MHDALERPIDKVISTQRASYISRLLVNESAPWLLCFEEHWAGMSSVPGILDDVVALEDNGNETSASGVVT